MLLLKKDGNGYKLEIVNNDGDTIYGEELNMVNGCLYPSRLHFKLDGMLRFIADKCVNKLSKAFSTKCHVYQTTNALLK
jgi:hypothetical protein